MPALDLPADAYVAVLELRPGDRLYCSDHGRDVWTACLGIAQPFRALQEAHAVARRHGGFAEPWREAQRHEAPSACAPPRRRTAMGPGQRCQRSGCGHARSSASEAHFTGNRRGAMGMGPCKVKGCLCPGYVP
ncbi:MAG: hypothetical protein QOD77_522 [Thermoplasmata archaeon]|nr:hypothetical protein [Thermoplasmata archaeon]